MIIKHADDKSLQLDTLRTATIKRIQQEIRNIQAGVRAEQEAAYEMKVRFEASLNWMVLHDLRIEHGGLVAQIDHLIINRILEMWVCESKHFSEGIAINEHGEFTAFFGGKPYGVPSPIAQNNRHILILKRLFDSGAVALPSRLGFTIKPDLRSLVLVSKGARIIRPKKSIEGLQTVIKNDLMSKTIDKSFDENKPMVIARIVGQDTLQSLARNIAKLHSPIQFDWNTRFGLTDKSSVPNSESITTTRPVQAHSTASTKFVCHSCSSPITYPVAKYCWVNKAKFGGNTFCMICQKKITPP